MADFFVTLGSLMLDGTDEHGVLWVCDPLIGWEDPASTIQVEPRTRAHGGVAGEAFMQPRTVVVEGNIVAPSASALVGALDRLNAAASLGETVLMEHGPSGDRWVRARRQGAVLAPKITATHARFSVQFVCPEPRRFGTELTAEIALPSSSGGLRFPVRFPLRFTAATTGGAQTLVNTGQVAGPVWLRLDGPSNPADPPLTGPVVTQVSTGRRLVFASSLSLGYGEWVDVDAERQTVLAQGTSSRAQWVTEDGFPTFEPGVNTYALSASVYSASSKLTVRALPAW